MPDYQVTVTTGDPVTVTAASASVYEGALFFGTSGNPVPAAVFAEGAWQHAVDPTAIVPPDPPADPGTP